jgi:hypothetical protein
VANRKVTYHVVENTAELVTLQKRANKISFARNVENPDIPRRNAGWTIYVRNAEGKGIKHEYAIQLKSKRLQLPVLVPEQLHPLVGALPNV